MAWINNDGLYIKYGAEEVAVAQGGEYAVGAGSDLVFELSISGGVDTPAATTILGASATGEVGSYGVVLPKGLYIKEVEITTESAFTVSGGTLNSAQLVIGLIREDRTTELDYDGISTTSLTGAQFAAARSRNLLVLGATGVGALVGTTLANDGIVTVSNPTQATNVLNAGRAIVRIIGYFPYTAA